MSKTGAISRAPSAERTDIRQQNIEGECEDEESFTLSAALLLCLPLLAPAQESKSDDEAAIRRVVRLYIEGVMNNDPESLSQSLHPKGKWFFPSYTQDLKEIRQGRVVENTRSNLKKGIRPDGGGARVVSVDVTDDVAIVKLEVERTHSYSQKGRGHERQTPGVKQTDYLSLLRPGGGWGIAGKVTTLEERQGGPCPTEPSGGRSIGEETVLSGRLPHVAASNNSRFTVSTSSGNSGFTT